MLCFCDYRAVFSANLDSNDVVQEILVVLFLVAALITTVFVIAVAFILFPEGIRRAVLWTKIELIRLPKLGQQGPLRPLGDHSSG